MSTKHKYPYKPGQVVRLKSPRAYVQLKSPRAYVQLYKKGGLDFIDPDGYVYAYGGNNGWFHVSELRLLTKKEKGE